MLSIYLIMDVHIWKTTIRLECLNSTTRLENIRQMFKIKLIRSLQRNVIFLFVLTISAVILRKSVLNV